MHEKRAAGRRPHAADFARQRGSRRGSLSRVNGINGNGVHQELKGVPVLIVEDDPASAKLMAIVVGGEGGEVRVARTAEEALVTLSSFRPLLIVLDLVLPVMSGLLLLQRLKADPELCNIVVIAVTALDGPEVERVAREAGCAAYVLKPIDPLSFPELLLAHLGEGP
jgi:CheY-like chemotaxis protein